MGTAKLCWPEPKRWTRVTWVCLLRAGPGPRRSGPGLARHHHLPASKFSVLDSGEKRRRKTRQNNKSTYSTNYAFSLKNNSVFKYTPIPAMEVTYCSGHERFAPSPGNPQLYSHNSSTRKNYMLIKLELIQSRLHSKYESVRVSWDSVKFRSRAPLNLFIGAILTEIQRIFTEKNALKHSKSKAQISYTKLWEIFSLL